MTDLARRIQVWAVAMTLVITWLGLPPNAQAQSVLINEILAESVLPDDDLEPPDWIELFNASDEDIDLDGWFLTDDPGTIAKWRIPAVTLEAKSFLRIFCSEQDLRDPAGELHTNFQLDQNGEFVAIARPDGEIEDQIAPFFPPIPTNTSYGRRQDSAQTELLSVGSEVRYLVPGDGSLGDTWKQPDFDDGTWNVGATGLGFDFKTVPSFAELVATDVRDGMHGFNATLYVRATFTVESLTRVNVVKLRIQFEDGFVAFINGVEIARRNAPEDLPHNARAIASQADRDVLEGEESIIADPTGILKEGENVLAIHALNNGASSRDFLVLAELNAFELLESDQRTLEYFEEPSPETPNDRGFSSVARAPEASRESTLVTESFLLELTSPDGGEIRYTSNGGAPDRESELYVGPISIDTSTRIRARAIVPDQVWSPIATFAFPMLDASVTDFNSNLPLLVIETFGVDIPDEPKVPGYVHVAEIDDTTGRSDLAMEPHYFGPMGIERRGSSTVGRIKASYSLETRDLEHSDRDLPLLGMPTESDWVLWGPMQFDRAMMRNPFMYQLSNQIGRYAVRTRYVEVFVNLDASKINRSNDYYGVYVFMEKIKQGPDRVDVEPIPRTATTEPEITGGYVLKRDRPGPGDIGLGDMIQHVYPREEETPAHQVTWLKQYIGQLNSALASGDFADPEVGYPKFIDVPSAIDFHILHEFAKNPDGFVVSTYFYKPRGQPIHWGPIWDFDRALGPDLDIRAQNPIGWSLVRLHNWWSRFFGSSDFQERYTDRWQELRAAEFSEANMHAIVDSLAKQIEEAQVRNYQRWTDLVSPAGGWELEVQQLKDWISQRLDWMDTQLFAPPDITPKGGFTTLPLEIELSTSSTIGDIYYTLNGPDPQVPGGNVHPFSTKYDGNPIPITEPTRIRARLRLRTGVWTNMAETSYYETVPTLAITEIMYNPTDGEDFEFVEFHNFGDEPVGLRSAVWTTFRQSVEISEGPETLGPGEYAVIVRNREKFAELYDTEGITIVGDFPEHLNNGGDSFKLRGSHGEPVLSFIYRSTWHGLTNGGGHSLVLIDPTTDPELYGVRDSWRPSFFPNGSPGEEDPTELPTNDQLPGDSNQDGSFNISDAIHLVRLLFRPEGAAFPCGSGQALEVSNLRILDANTDFRIDTSDVIHNLTYLFGDGPPHGQGTACLGLRDCPDVCETDS